ncbi:zinc-dependent alcohol dehydrogenase family protein [Legionella micdadei]|uniref:alcohol dehydrogenase n=1 Tax=Legionella micdadei TaxID=451 RepID=A0A098GDF0_LEGMI|nr:zinc-dependent alcohol dehydrogenase family protein [Legionella micdadei]ARG97882.1 alcohol dehydrogenase [Legionella micdadei]KTD28603.1 alcohol dehydrogenase [Legionella micdadei]NSL19194.1 zinc-dependent alcohol dehydrogenase family protein [Legionella micdadei]CEG60504.1 putative alcohol dehydrogenase AdhA [Legionella micdadei]SCX80174.1 alcohol dehydrogenase, propanol-preferring [Legionella micdadei]
MHAMQMQQPKQELVWVEVGKPKPAPHEILIKVRACGICRTDLHVVDGELENPKLPLIPGHQIVGHIEKLGEKVKGFELGQRVGVPWLGGSCGKCNFCLSGRENLCDEARFTGYQIDGGFAEYCVADSQFCFPIPIGYPDYQAAPLFCAGLIGYRALLKTGDAKHLGLYGFGAAAHILIQVARQQGREVYAFTSPGDRAAQDFAYQLGASWAGGSDQKTPHLLEAAIIFAPVGSLVPLALRNTAKGGIVVCAGIHMSDIPRFPYEILWGERTLCSVANLTRKDGEEFLSLAPTIPVKTEVHTYPLREVNRALDDLRYGRFTGAAVITI